MEKKPEWLKIRASLADEFQIVRDVVKKNNLHTVCEEAHCPNIPECWNSGTATFMILGDTCTRACKFCNVKTGFPGLLVDKDEPENLANAVKELNLNYIVITSVDRDDIKDQGSEHFANCIKSIKNKDPEILVEVLIPDFKGNMECLKRIVDSNPDVISHNIETVRRLQNRARDPRANYSQSLAVLKNVKRLNPNIYTKSSIMLGLGETREEVIQTLADLRNINVDFVTLGQYLRPSDWHIEVSQYIPPEEFDFYKEKALELGFLYCASGPFVRSSYKAGEFFIKKIIKKVI